MSLSADQIMFLVNAGLSAQQLAEFAKLSEKPRSASAERMARKRARDRGDMPDEPSHVTRHSDASPSSSSLSPTPPILTTSPKTLSPAREVSQKLIEAAGEALADPASCPSALVTKTVTDLLQADPPCTEDDLVEAARFAGAWYVENRGKRTMKGWKLCHDKAVEYRNARLTRKPVEGVARSPPSTGRLRNDDILAAMERGLSGG